MESCKLKSKKLKKILSDITNTTHKKPKSKKSSKPHSKTGSGSKFEELGLSSEKNLKSKEFYINIKESQVFNLASAIKLNIENIKCRYKLAERKLIKLRKKKAWVYSKLLRPTPTPDIKHRFNIEYSPISHCDSQSAISSFSNTIEHRTLFQKASFYEFEKKLTEIEDDNSKIICSEFRYKEKIKAIGKKRRDLIIAIGILYEKKTVLGKNRFNIEKLQRKNEELKENYQILANSYKQMLKTKGCNERKGQQLEMEKLLIQTRAEEVARRRDVVKQLDKDLKEKTEEVRKKEAYLKEILTIKSKMLSRIETMKQFDSKLEITKDAARRAFSVISNIPKKPALLK
jgi:hypothetical protein